MKGECEGRELTPGAPVRVGAGVAPEHSREEASERIEAGAKSENRDIDTRSLQIPTVVGGNHGNGTRGFTVAELTKVDNVASPLGTLQIPSVKDGAIGSYRVPSFREDCQGRSSANLGETNIQGWSENMATGTLKIPGFKGEDQEYSGALDLTRVSHGITSGNLHIAGANEEGHSGSIQTLSMAQQKGESYNTNTLMKDSITGSSNVINTRRETPRSAAERNCMGTSKRLNQDGVGMKPLEAVIKRLKQDACASVTASNTVDSKRCTENNSMASSDVTAVKRFSEDGASGITGMTDVKRKRQSSSTETAGSTLMVRESHSSIKETVNGACFKNMSQDRPTSAEHGGSCEKEGQDNVLAKADAKNINLSSGTEFVQVGADNVENHNSAIKSKENSDAKELLEGNSVKSPAQPVMQEKESSISENLNVPPVETACQVQSSEISLVPDKGKETPETIDGNAGSTAGPCIKNETQDSPAVKPSVAVKDEEHDKDTDKERLPVPKEELEDKRESKQDSSVQGDGEGVAKECEGDASESKVPVSDHSKSPSTKPEMVSIETQCDGNGMGPNTSAEDEYAFISDDVGVPGECLGACEPGRKPHKCFQCDTSFRTPYELSRHSRVHSGERPYQCRLCHRCFKRKDHVEVHTRRHVEDRRHICGLCGVCFVTSSCLLRHQRRTHQAVGNKLGGEGEDGEVEVEVVDFKGEGKDPPTSKDAQRNGRRNKKNKPDTTYRPGGKTVCIIKKRNLRQRSYSFVELEDDVECFESDEEDRIPFLKVQEQRQEEEREEFGGQASQLDHSLFPGSFFSSEASLGHLLLLGEVSRLLSHSLIPGPLEVPDSQANGTQAGRLFGPEAAKENEADSDDSDCDPPLVACDVTFMEGEGEVAGLSLPDDNPATPTNPEETTLLTEEDKSTSQIGSCHVTLKGEPCQAMPGAKETLGTNSTPLGESRMARQSHPCGGSPIPPISGRAAASATNNKTPGTGFGAMGVPRTAWVVPTNNSKGKNTCDACRRRNEANRLAQMEKERQNQAAKGAPNQMESKTEETQQDCTAKVVTKDPPPAPPPPKPQKPRPPPSKRGRKPNNSKKKRQGKSVGVAEGAAAASKRPHKCQLCPFNFRSATELKRHASTHSGERPFLCELCGAGFVRKCHLQLHVRRHSGERRHACQECRMRFFTPSDLARHQAIHQVGDKPLECHLCHLTFRRAFHLERHIRRHNDAAPFACKLCGAFFSSAAALRSHDKHHRTPGPHACPDCTAAFTTATALSRHRRVHSARHHRLLRAVERHATAKSSYECVSSKGSPLSLVIRKVASTAGASGEEDVGPTKDSDVPSDPAHEGKEEEERTVDVSTPPVNKEMEEVEKGASSHSITAAESEGKSEGSENITFSPSSTIKEKDENITTNPSVTEKIKKDSERCTPVLPSPAEVTEESQTLSSDPSTLDKVNKDSEDIPTTSSLTNVEEESEIFSSITDVANYEKLKGREKITSTPSKGTSAKEETDIGSFIEENTAAEEDPYVFKLTAFESQVGIKSGIVHLSSKSNTKRNRKYEELSKSSDTNSGKEIYSKSIYSFYDTDRETEHIEESGNKAIYSEKDHLEELGNLTTCGPTKEEEEVSNEELKDKLAYSLPPMSQERKEAKRGGMYDLFAPAGQEAEAVKEIHCRTTYHLTAPSEGQESTVQAGSGCPSEQEGSSSSQDGGQANSVREGVATTS